ncbi:F1F0 ATP synthase [Dipodascopsis tothii]|uniref:F1F0 ATP synthase n=1 Tax=Dipodascopsis tothii TaxID=44089 RepID=UPI0034CFCEFB
MRAPSAAQLLRAAPRAALYSTQPEPKSKAAAVIDALPGSSVLSKTGILATGSAAAIYAISNELYILNDESTLLAVFTAFAILTGKVGGPAYSSWAQGYIDNMKSILNKAREDHTSAVKDRITSVSQLKDVVATTKALFSVSKETVELEAKAFELKQSVDFAAEAKSVLDSWVRYEASVRQREQKALVESVIAKIEKEVSTPKFQQQVLAQSVAEIEKIFKA